jgi:hypothetical protein
VGGVPPRKLKKGRVANPCNPATRGTQNAGEPKAYEDGQRGWRGRSPLPGGLGDVPPKFSKKERATNSYHPTTRGTQNAGKPKAHEGGQWGSRGRKPPDRGSGGCAPRIKRGGDLPTLATPPRGGPRTLANPKLTRVGNGGPGGLPPGGGLWGVSPHENLKGASCQPLQPCHEGDQKRWRTQSPRGWAKQETHKPGSHPVLLLFRRQRSKI